MRTLAQAPFGDIPVISGESGAAGLAALEAVMANDEWRSLAGLRADSRVLLISTEGATAPNVYARIVGDAAENVRAAQNRWLEAHRTS